MPTTGRVVLLATVFVAAIVAVAVVQGGKRVEAAGYSLQVPSAWSVQPRGSALFASTGSGRSSARIQVESRNATQTAESLLDEQWARSIRGWTVDGAPLDAKTEIGGSALLVRTARLTLGTQEQFYAGLVLRTPEANYWADLTATDRTLHDATLLELTVALKTLRGSAGKVPGEFTATPPTPPTTAQSQTPPPTTAAGTATSGTPPPGTATGTGTAQQPATPPPAAQLAPRELSEEELQAHARLRVLAAELSKEGTDKLALLTEAAVLCGFSLREDGRIVQTPSPDKRLGLILDMSEVRATAIMQENGATVSMADWCAGMDTLWAKVAPGAKSSDLVLELMNTAWLKPGTAPRAWVAFLNGLSDVSGLGPLDGTRADAELDAIQGVMLTRWVSELVSGPMRQWWKNKRLEESLMDGDAWEGLQGDPNALPGWAEDAAAGVGNKFGEKLREQLLKTLNASNLAKEIAAGAVEGLGALGSIVKFICSYAYLKGELKVLPPGNPLIRRLDGSGGEERTLQARFWIEGNEIQNMLKDNRLALNALTGFTIDFDQPKTQPLGGIHTWDIRQDRFDSKHHAIRTVRGMGDISKLKTDAEGQTKLRVEGAPRSRALVRKDVIPYTRRVHITVTPQLKEVSMQQDLVDAFFGSAGVRNMKKGAGGVAGAGLLVSVMNACFETLYRMNWKGGREIDLLVTDYVEAAAVGSVTVEYEERRTTSDPEGGTEYSLKGSLKAEGLLMGWSDPTAFKEFPPGLGADTLKTLPPDQRKLMEAEIAKWRAEQEKNKAEINGIWIGGGNVEASRAQSARRTGVTGGGEGTKGRPYSASETSSMNVRKALELGGDKSFFFMVTVDPKTGIAKISVDVIGETKTTTTTGGAVMIGPPAVRTGQGQFMTGPQVEGASLNGLPCSFSATKTDHGTTIYEGTFSRPTVFQSERIGRINVIWKVEVRDPVD